VSDHLVPHFNLILIIAMSLFFCRYLYSRGSGENQKLDVGVCSNYLTHIEKDEEIKFEIDRTRMHLPADPSSAVLFICTVSREPSLSCFLFIFKCTWIHSHLFLAGYRICSNERIDNATSLLTTSRTEAWACLHHLWLKVFKRRFVHWWNQDVSSTWRSSGGIPLLLARAWEEEDVRN